MEYNYSYYWLQHLKGLIVRECASSYRNLSTFPEEYVIVDSDLIPQSFSCSFGEINKVANLNLSRCEKVKEGLYITDDERTIIDMIEWQSEGQLIEQCLENYLLNHNGEINELLNYSKERNLYNELIEWLEIVEEEYGLGYKR